MTERLIAVLILIALMLVVETVLYCTTRNDIVVGDTAIAMIITIFIMVNLI